MRRMSELQMIYEILVADYGEPQWRVHLEPLDELISTILSQNTNDVNRDRAFARLKDRYNNWELVVNAPTEEVAETIRPAGLANRKAPRIKNALEAVKRECGDYSLEFLREMELGEARSWLLSLPGVGPKTAAIVLLFGFGRPAFPVDTHVHRVTRRLGVISENTNAERAHQVLEKLIPPEQYYVFHLNLISHGRAVCRARNPQCVRCSLATICKYNLALGTLD
ncbi:MAG: endonuclease III [Chloroflexota bacterium]